MPVESTWASRDLPVLEAIVERDGSDLPPERSLAETAGVDTEGLQLALQALAKADPPFLSGIVLTGSGRVHNWTGVTERALVAIGQWPSPDSLADSLVIAFVDAADREPDPERRSKMKAAALVVGGMMRSVIAGWAAGELPHPH